MRSLPRVLLQLYPTPCAFVGSREVEVIGITLTPVRQSFFAFNELTRPDSDVRDAAEERFSGRDFCHAENGENDSPCLLVRNLVWSFCVLVDV